MKKDYLLDYYDNKEFDELIKKIEDLTDGCTEIESYPGSLTDNYLIEVSEFRFKYNVHRKYLIAYENYLSDYASNLKVILTDDDKEVEQFYKKQDQIFDEIENI